MEKNAMIKNLLEIYDRTIANCLFYERENKKAHLLNEIGVLRGVAYCLESMGMCPHTAEFLRLINLQNELTKGETT
jgi:hypothetical protein